MGGLARTYARALRQAPTREATAADPKGATGVRSKARPRAPGARGLKRRPEAMTDKRLTGTAQQPLGASQSPTPPPR
eukprot:11161993-Lingulodinium_polyedra.AAC.1